MHPQNTKLIDLLTDDQIVGVSDPAPLPNGERAHGMNLGGYVHSLDNTGHRTSCVWVDVIDDQGRPGRALIPTDEIGVVPA